MYGASRQFDKIIQNIMMQDYSIRRLGIDPNRVVLGKSVYDILHADFNGMLDFKLEGHNPYGMNAYVCGLPVTIDHDNKWIIEVCYGFERDGRDILYPDKNVET